MEVSIDDNSIKTFSLSYKHVILGYYIKDHFFKGVGFIIHFISFSCKFHIHKCKFTNGKPHLNSDMQSQDMAINAQLSNCVLQLHLMYDFTQAFLIKNIDANQNMSDLVRFMARR